MKHEDFDPKYLRALFDYGYAKGRAGYPWHKAPPILEAAAEEQKVPERTPAKAREK